MLLQVENMLVACAGGSRLLPPCQRCTISTLHLRDTSIRGIDLAGDPATALGPVILMLLFERLRGQRNLRELRLVLVGLPAPNVAAEGTHIMDRLLPEGRGDLAQRIPEIRWILRGDVASYGVFFRRSQLRGFVEVNLDSFLQLRADRPALPFTLVHCVEGKVCLGPFINQAGLLRTQRLQFFFGK